MKLYIDIETYSTVPIAHGLDRYADGAEVILVAYAIDDGPVHIWDRAAVPYAMPAVLRQALTNADKLVAHNSQFDRTVLSRCGILSTPGPERWVDTMIQAYAHGLPGSLDTLCQIFGLGADVAKMKEGRRLIHLFCKPQKAGRRVTGADEPELWHKFIQYARHDVKAMRVLHYKLPKWNYPNGTEYPYWLIDQHMNERGYQVDTALARAAIELQASEKQHLDAQTWEATGGAVNGATQRDALLAHVLEAWGVKLPDMQAATLTRRIEDDTLPDELRELLRVRLSSSKNTASKYKTLIKSAGADERLRYTMQFCGALTTGRTSGRLFQPQNLMRPTMKPDQIEQAIEAIKAGAAEFLYNNITEVVANCVRGSIIAPAGKKLVVSDLSSIEARIISWLAGDHGMLLFYSAFDAGEVKYDQYQVTYADAFGIDPSEVNDKQRSVGKVLSLACGYGGGVAAFRTFANVYRLDLQQLARDIQSTAEPNQWAISADKYTWAKERGFHGNLPEFQFTAFDYVVHRWRRSRPKITAFWEALHEGYRHAVIHPGKKFVAGQHITFERRGQWLRMRLPSGRYLSFIQPKAGDDLSYAGQDRYTRKWGRVNVYGGKLAGLATQATAACLLRSAVDRIEAHDDYMLVLTVHDEVVTESASGNAEELSALLATNPEWAEGLPLAAEGYEATRYRK